MRSWVFPCRRITSRKEREASPAARDARDVVLKEKVMRVWKDERGREVYGAGKVWLELNAQGVVVARCTVERLMRDLGIAIADHDDIREAISEAALQRVGSVAWWHAVRAVVTSSIEHIDREECDVLAESLLTVTITRRRELGRQWRAFIAAWRLDTAPRPSGHPPRPREVSLPARSVPIPNDRL